jgi:tripartite motif-containing protein 71
MHQRRTLVVCLLCSLLHFGSPPAALAEPSPPAAATSSLVPLPKSCGGGLPPGAAAPACCLFGYVFIDGQAVAGAKVTVIRARDRLEDWTVAGPDSPLPYYRLSLSGAPLNAGKDDSIDIQVEYGGHRRVVRHVVLSGGQQVDVVLPRNQSVDYVFDRQFWAQPPAGQFSYVYGVAVNGAGHVYVTDNKNARVQVFNGDGRFLFQWGTLGNEPGEFSNPNGIALDAQANVYVVDEDNNRVQKFSSSGVLLGLWGSKGSGDGQLMEPRGIAVDRRGNVFVADAANHRILQFTTAGRWIRSWGQRGTALGQFEGPRGVAVDADGNVYVADHGNHRIQKFTRNGDAITSWGSFGNGPGEFSAPYGLAIDRSNTLYVADSGNDRIQRLSLDGMPIRAWGSPGRGDGAFLEPLAVAADSSGNVYVGDTYNHRVQQFASDGSWRATWGSAASEVTQLQFPRGIALTGSAIYVADTGHHQVKKLRRDGSVAAVWGERGAANGQFEGPRDVAVDADGNVYVADTDNHRVQKFSSNGVWLGSWGGAGSGRGQFNSPRGIEVAGDGTIYVADTLNHRVQRFSGSFVWLTMWGSEGGNRGQFNLPVGIAVDRQSSVYVVDSGNRRVQKFDASGAPILDWSTARNANDTFRAPQMIAVDGGDNVFLVDTSAHEVHKFSPTGRWLAGWGTLGAGDGQLAFPAGIAVDWNDDVYVADKDNFRLAVFRRMESTLPIATIVAIEPRSLVQGEMLELRGTGSDTDATPAVAEYEWLLDGAATPVARGADATLATATLAPGRHTIGFRVRDTEGEVSPLQTQTIDVSPANTPQAARWTFLLYLDGDAPNLATYLNRTSPLGALYRIERAAPNPLVTTAVLYDGPRDGDTFRYLIGSDGSFSQESLGEVNMGDPQTLIDFARWGLAQAPADHTYLALADHATALDGIAWDLTSGRNERLTPGEIRSALVAITEGGGYPLDVLHFDGCLMGLIEPAYQVRGLARYLVASENLGWSAFAYEQYRALVTPQLTPQGLAEGIAARYAEVVGGQDIPYTIAALDLAQVDTTARATDALAEELLRYALASGDNRAQLAQLRSQVQKLDSGADFLLQNEDEYLDLDHLAEVLAAGLGDDAVRSRALEVRAAIGRMVLRNYAASGPLAAIVGVPGAGYELSRARGLGIYYPPRPSVRTYRTYVQGELNFVTDTEWDEYLAAGLAALPFDPSEPEPRPVEPLPFGFGNGPYRVALPRVDS